MISLALIDDAFESRSLTSVESVFAARVPDGREFLAFQWKAEWLKRPVFRGSNDDLSRPMAYATLRDLMNDHSLAMGYPERIGPKDWRRNVGNVANRTATGPERDLIMRRASVVSCGGLSTGKRNTTYLHDDKSPRCSA